MSVPDTARESADPSASGYAAYGQLARMLLPSSGCLAIYAVDGDLSWCSDGFERPDFRELVDALRAEDDRLKPNQGTVRQTSAGVSALAARLAAADGRPLGYVLIELGAAHAAGNSMATSLTRPFISCLASQIALEQPPAAAPHVESAPEAEPEPEPEPEPHRARYNPRLGFLLGLSEIDLNSPHAVRLLLERCVDDLDCVSAVFCVPDQDLIEVAEQSSLADAESRARLDATRKHLLAWAQLNNRPMVVNESENARAPYKILSSPVAGKRGAANGIIALFRSKQAIDFELDDVRMIEFVSRQAMALLYERQDALSGLMSRSAFEAYLEERLPSEAEASHGQLLYFDIDSLKSINDAVGFAAGDEVILRTAQLIRRSLMPGERACRIASDRFAVHLVERDAEGAAALGSEVAKSAEALGYSVQGQRLRVSLSFGIAEPPDSAANGRARHWIAAAERACQLQKSRSQTADCVSSQKYNVSRSV